MAVYRSESPLFLSGDNSKDIETLRNYLYERDMELRYILEHLDAENMSQNFLAGLSTQDFSGGTVAEGGTGLTELTEGYYLKGNGTDAVALESPADVLANIGGQKQMCVATASTTSSAVVGGADIPLRIFTEYDPLNNFTNARYNSTYGYGIRCVNAGKYMVSAMAALKSTVDESITATLAIRKVVSGTSTYIARAGHTFKLTNDGSTITIPPVVVSLDANSYLSLYQSLATVSTLADGCHLTAIYLGE